MGQSERSLKVMTSTARLCRPFDQSTLIFLTAHRHKQPISEANRFLNMTDCSRGLLARDGYIDGKRSCT